MSITRRTLLPLLLFALLGPAAAQGVKDPVGPDKVVYHVNAGLEQA